MDHGGCALLVSVRKNRIVDIKGDPRGVLNRGYICPKGRASAMKLNHPDRLRQPLKRRGPRGGGKWEPTSWGQALSTIADHLIRIRKENGARSVAFCQGMPKGLEHFVLIRLANTFGSPNVVTVQDVCHAPREIGGYHTCGFYPVADYDHPGELAVLWGSNITATNEEGQICRQLFDAMKKGTEIIVVDPLKTELADRAKIWLQLKPGTDAALALGFLHVVIEESLFDARFVQRWTHGFESLAAHVKHYPPETVSAITRVPPEKIREAARAYASAQPAALGWGNAIEQNRCAFDTVRALVCLMAVCGNLDVPGGNIQAREPGLLSPGKFVRADLLPDKKNTMLHAHRGTVRGLMTVPPAYFKEAILEEDPYPIRAAYIQCTNPVITHAGSPQTVAALNKLDFLAVADIVMTPTAALADVVLPAATQFEFDDIGHYGLGHGIVLARPKLVDPPPDCWPDLKILNELGKIVTEENLWFDDHRQLLELLLSPTGLTYDAFARKGYLKKPPEYRKYRSSGFRTPSGKVELALSRAETLNTAPLPVYIDSREEDAGYPLTLTALKSPDYLHSSYRWLENLRARSPKPVVWLNPITAKTYGIRDGCTVEIETRNGSIRQSAKLTNRVAEDVIFAAHGWWFPEDRSSPQYDWRSANYNMLTDTENLGKPFGTPNLKGIACRIRHI